MSQLPNGPNIVVLILDSLRARQVGCYGYERSTTPNLDAFARESVLFRQAFSPATWTVPSHASLLTGLYVSQHRIESVETERRFNESIVTLPELLSRHGYRTAAFSHNPLFSPAQGLGDGFEEFYEMDDLARSRLRARRLDAVVNGSSGTRRSIAQYRRRTLAPGLTLRATRRWIGANAGEGPYFVLANVLAPHFPWAVPLRVLARTGTLRRRFLTRRDFLTLKDNWAFNAGVEAVTEEHREAWHRLYDAAVVHVDQVVGRFLRWLSSRPDAQNTIVVVTSDHGEMLGEHGDIVGHLLTLHDNLTHVPLIIRHPGSPRGLEVDAVVQTHDLYSTVVDWAEVSTDGVPAAQLRRPSLMTTLERPASSTDFAFAEEDYSDSYDILGKLRSVNPQLDPERYPLTQTMIRSATHKYVQWRSVSGVESGELYGLENDPLEEHNLLRRKRRPAVLPKLRNALASWRKSLETFPPREADEGMGMDEVTTERLRALGYIP